MKGRLILLAGLMVALVAGGAWAEEGKKSKGRGGLDGQGRRKGRHGMHKRFDKDGDGKLSEDERAAAKEAWEARKAQAIKAFDKDGDGELNEEERKAAHEARKAKFAERRKEMLEKFDQDGDGELGPAERKAAHEAFREKRRKGESGDQV